MEIKNAKIDHTFLGIEDHGMMTFFLHLVGESWGQGWGGYNLGVGIHWPAVIREILNTFHVDSWENLEGVYCRVRWPRGSNEQPEIGHLMENKWLNMVELVEKCKNK